MTASPDIWEAITSAEEREDWDMCIQLCEEAIAAQKGGSARRLKLKLAYALLEARSNQRENLEGAIAVYTELLSGLDSGNREWGEISKNLGYAYQNRVAGKRSENLAAAVRHYENALSTMASADPLVYASVAAETGHALLECQTGDSRRNRERAIKHLEQALKVFTPQEYPEEFDEISRALYRSEQNVIRETPDD